MSSQSFSSESSSSNGDASASTSTSTGAERDGASTSTSESGSPHDMPTPRLCAVVAETGDERSGSSSSAQSDADSVSEDRLVRLKSKPQKEVNQLLESRAEHMRRHAKESDQKGCQRCLFYKHQAYFEEKCQWEHPSGEKYSWLMEAPQVESKLEPWGLGCSVCRWAGLKTAWAMCTRRTTVKLSRHSHGKAHQMAVKKYAQYVAPRLRAADGSSTLEVCGSGVGVGFAHVLRLLDIVHGGQSLRSFKEGLDSIRIMGGDVNCGNSSARVARQLLAVCAGKERHTTKALVANASVAGIAQDARDSELLVCCRLVAIAQPYTPSHHRAEKI